MKHELTDKRIGVFCARALGVALLVVACGGSVTKAPAVGSESHFLARCERSCEGGLDCIGGICTRSCLTERASCTDLAAAAACTNQSVEPGEVAVCDVSCRGSSDCAGLGDGYACSAGFCRGGSEAPSASGGTSGGSGGGGSVSGGSVSGGTGGNSTNGGGTSSPIDCEPFRDQSPPPDVRAISITNTGGVPLYILPAALACPLPTSLVQVLRDDEPVNIFGSPDCTAGCQQVMEEGWPYGVAEAPTNNCVSDCPLWPRPVLIEPLQTLQQPVSLEVVSRQLPQSCAAGISSETVACYSRGIPQPGNYVLRVRAALSLACDAPGDCDCRPDAGGSCTNSNVSIRAAPLVFTLPSPWYFQNQELTIAAP